MNSTTNSLPSVTRLFFSTIIFAVLVAGPTSGAWAASFQGLGHLTDGNFLFSQAFGVSGDGSTIVGRANSASGNEAFRWTSDTGMVGLGDLPGGSFSSAALGVSADGSIIVGGGVSTSGNEAFRWTSGTGMVGLGDLPGGSFGSTATGISADGSTIVGSSNSASGNEAFRWTSGGGIQGLGDPPGDSVFLDVFGVSRDGSTIVGTAKTGLGTGDNITEAIKWTSDTGPVLLGGLGLQSSDFISSALAVSGDGSTIVGSVATLSGRGAAIWDATHGMRSLRDVLTTEYGLGDALTGWDLFEARGISDDGLTIVGRGHHSMHGFEEAWVVQLDAPQPVPEPSTFLLLGTGLAGIVAWRRKPSV